MVEALSINARRTLLLQYLMDMGLPPWAKDQIEPFAYVLDITEDEAKAALDELVERKMIQPITKD